MRPQKYTHYIPSIFEFTYILGL